METDGETELAADVSYSKLPPNAAVESSGAEDDDREVEELPSVQFVKSRCFKRLIQVSIVVSAISVAMNTSKTFEKNHKLWYVTLTLDIVVLTLLVVESVMDMKILGLWSGNRAFFRNRVNLFNLVMVLFIATSLLLQIVEEPSNYHSIPNIVKVIVRAPRAFILLRVMKYFMNYSLLNQVSRRSGKQIRNVTIFLLYFMTLASLIGVQLFGEKSYYCVKNGTDVKNVTYKDLSIPEIRCGSPNSRQGGTRCPPNFVCRHLELPHFNQSTQYFENMWYSFLTVYESSTQEGWVLVMYAEMHSQNFYVSAIYFVLLIFFVVWLVKSVFIAVITETFADLRSQLYLKNWRTNRRVTGLSSEIIQDDGNGWHLVAIKEEWTKTKAFNRARQFLTSKYFRFMTWTLLAVEALVQAINGPQRPILQLVFTIIFDIESLFKIWCVGIKSYWKIPVYRFELFLAVGSSLCIGPVMKGFNILVAFQVLRVTRIIIAVPSLNAFLYKAFGTGTKIFAVVIFTIFFLVFASILSLQLFSSMDFEDEEGPFDDFLKASSSMFQIITQEGWVEVLDMVRYASLTKLAPLVSIYFTMYNLFASLILGSVFIAVILDNLEIEEETKILKQRKLGEECLNIQEKLPRRLQVFEKFKERPRLVETWKVSGDFPVPKVRQSFMRKFLDDSRTHLLRLEENPSVYEDALLTQSKDLPFKLLSSSVPDDIHTLRVKKRSSLTQLIQDSTRRRNLTEHGTPVRHSAKSYVLGYTARQINRNATKLTQGARKTSERADMSALTRMRSLRGNNQATLPHSTTAGNTEDWNIKELRARREQAQRVKAAHEESLRENHPYFDFPLFLVSRDSRARQWLQKIVHARYDSSGICGDVQSKRPMFNDTLIKRVFATQTYLEWIIIVITLSSCLAMMFEKPNYRTFDVPALAFFEYLFVVSTSLELVIRVLADGLFFTPNAVIRDSGDVIDISIYFIGLVYVCWSPDFIPAHSAAQALLIMRALRPLRIINLIPKMRQVIQELFGGYKEILKVAALQLSLMFIFASYGVQMFSGKLGKCNDQNLTKEQCSGTFLAELKGPQELRGLNGEKNKILVPRIWKNPKNFDFDNILHALLALFEALSLEGWLDIRNVIEKQESLGILYGFYIHGYVLMGCMIGLALFVGVVVNNFNENKGTALLTVDQRRWEDLRKRLRLAQPLHLPLRPDDSAVRSRLYDFTQSSYYRRAIVCVVVLNCGTLAVVPWSVVDSASDPWPNILMRISVVFTIVFVVDSVLKIIAVTFMGYWRSYRNRFEFILTLSGILWIILYFVFHNEPKSYGYYVTVWLGVVVILFRFLSLSGKHDTLKMLMMTVFMSLVRSFYIIFVLVLIIMSYALIGVILFGTVKHGVAINSRANFQGSINAMIMLFRITTGEDWNKVMHDCMIQKPYCTEATDRENYWNSDCGSVPLALSYFISFYVILTFILLNLFIAVIIENFSLFYSSEEDAAISNHDVYQYQLTWNLVDQNRRGFITVRQARLILRLLRGRLGVDPSSFRFKHICLEIEKLRGGREVSFHDLLEILAYRSIDELSRSLQLEELLARAELERSIEEEVAIQTIRDWFLNLKKDKIKKSRGFSFGGASSASSVESTSTDTEEEQPNRLSVKPFQKRSGSSKTGTPSASVNGKAHENIKKELDEKVEDQSPLDTWFTGQLTA